MVVYHYELILRNPNFVYVELISYELTRMDNRKKMWVLIIIRKDILNKVVI